MTLRLPETIRQGAVGVPVVYGSESQVSLTDNRTLEAALASVTGGSIADWNNATTYNANDLVIRVNRIYRSLRTNTNVDPADSTSGNDWVFIGRSNEALIDIIDAEIRNHPGSSGSSRLGSYTDKLISIANAITRQSDDNFNSRLNAAEGIGAYYSWRGDEAAYSPTNTDGVLESGGSGSLASSRASGSNLVVGLGHLNYLKGFISGPPSSLGIIWGRSPSGSTGDEIPLIRVNHTLQRLEYNINGVRGTGSSQSTNANLNEQFWVPIRTAAGGEAGYSDSVSNLAIRWEVSYGTGHLDPLHASSRQGAYHEVVLGYHTGAQYVACQNFRISTANNGTTNLANPSSDFDVTHDVDFWDADAYTSHDEIGRQLAQENIGRLAGNLVIEDHLSSHTRLDFGNGGIELVGGLVDSEGKQVGGGGGGGTNVLGLTEVFRGNYDVTTNDQYVYVNGLTPGSNEFTIDATKQYFIVSNATTNNMAIAHGNAFATGAELLQYAASTAGDNADGSNSFSFIASAHSAINSYNVGLGHDAQNRLLVTASSVSDDPQPLIIYEVAEAGGGGSTSAKTNNLVETPGTSQSFVLPEDWQTYDYLIINGVDDGGQHHGVPYFTDHLARGSTTKLRFQGNEELTWNMATRTISWTSPQGGDNFTICKLVRI